MGHRTEEELEAMVELVRRDGAPAKPVVSREMAIADSEYVLEWLLQRAALKVVPETWEIFTLPDNIKGLAERALKGFADVRDIEFDEADPIPLSQGEIERIMAKVTQSEPVAYHPLPTEPAWLTRLAEAKGTHSMSDFAAHQIAKYVRDLREAAWPIVRELEIVGDETNWKIGDETDRVYPWYEIEPLKTAVLGG